MAEEDTAAAEVVTAEVLQPAAVGTLGQHRAMVTGFCTMSQGIRDHIPTDSAMIPAKGKSYVANCKPDLLTIFGTHTSYHNFSLSSCTPKVISVGNIPIN